jgi:tRNA 2-thiouridine synthesizing protein A
MSALPVVDCRGLLCPLPILHIRLKVNELCSGDEILAYCDDPSFERDLAQFCRLASLTCLEVLKQSDYTSYRLKLNDISHL